MKKTPRITFDASIAIGSQLPVGLGTATGYSSRFASFAFSKQGHTSICNGAPTQRGIELVFSSLSHILSSVCLPLCLSQARATGRKQKHSENTKKKHYIYNVSSFSHRFEISVYVCTLSSLSRVCSDEQQGAQVARQAVQDVVRSRLILRQSCVVVANKINSKGGYCYSSQFPWNDIFTGWAYNRRLTFCGYTTIKKIESKTRTK